jgi:hypothetical protein
LRVWRVKVRDEDVNVSKGVASKVERVEALRVRGGGLGTCTG